MIFNQVVSRAASEISFFPIPYSRWVCGKSRMSKFTVSAKQYLLLPARFWSWLIIVNPWHNWAECIIYLYCILKNVFLSQWFSTCLSTKHITKLVYHKKANKNVSKMYYHEQHRPNNMYKIITKKVTFPIIKIEFAF